MGSQGLPGVVLRLLRAGAAWAILLHGTGAVAADLGPELRQRMTTLETRGGVYIRGLAIASGDLLPRFYAGRNHAPAWTDPGRVDELFELLAAAPDHGLDPADYNLEPLRQLRAEQRAHPSAALGADLDILYTESLVRFGYHQRFGKVNPARLEPTWNFTRQYRDGQDPLSTLNAALAAPSFRKFLEQWIRRPALYRDLMGALADYRRLAAAGGWPVVPGGSTLKPGEADDRVPVLRDRLAVTGDLPAAGAGGTGVADPLLFEGAVVAGLRRFQARHSLAVDGVLGARTLAALNVPVEQRVDQLRLSLERARWVLDDTVGDFLVVNIAGFEVFVARDGRLDWWRRAVVGRTVRQTPTFKGAMTWLDLNPTWTIPPTILREDVLPAVRRDPGYLARNNIRVLDRQGQVVDPATVDWSVPARSFPWMLRQEPGPENALGRIKFMFPNPHAIFLHDTPAKELFNRPERLFSSGCIRVEDPLELATIVLGEPAVWNPATLQAAIDEGKTRTIRLKRPWPVLVLYWTAELDGGGSVRFLRDVYQRDAALLKALNGEVRIEFPAVTPL